jgi:N-acetylmuramoyl-L-alanine amidase
MSRWAKRHFYIPVSALTTIFLVASLAPTASASSESPAPYVIAIDAGHGGTPDDNHPDLSFDPGGIANGLVEKDLTLDVARRLRRMLEAEAVRVVMTRNSDTYVDISRRGEIANDAKAGLFISIHFNHFPDSSVSGSLVFYPNPESAAFAMVMSDSLDQRLGPLGIGHQPTVMNPNLWVHARMPTVTVEAAYLTNSSEASLLRKPAVLEAIAAGIRNGALAQDPAIKTRKAQMTAWEAAQARAQISFPTPKGSWWPALMISAALLSIAFVARRSGAGFGRRLALAGDVLVRDGGATRRRRSRYPRRRGGLAARDLPTLEFRRR